MIHVFYLYLIGNAFVLGTLWHDDEVGTATNRAVLALCGSVLGFAAACWHVGQWIAERYQLTFFFRYWKGDYKDVRKEALAFYNEGATKFTGYWPQHIMWRYALRLLNRRNNYTPAP